MSVLLLAGTGEARRLAARIGEAGVPVLASLAGAVRAPLELDVPVRIGGFGGDEGFRRVLREAGIRAVVDATHPFAAVITARTHAICSELGLPHLRLERPPWPEEAGWIKIGSAAEAAAHLPEGAVVFLATGRQSLSDFAGVQGCRLYLRVIDPPDGPFPHPPGAYLVGRPPFDPEGERALFRKLGVDWLVAKNSGGGENRAKLDAARELGIGVVMIRRPPRPAGMAVVETVEAAMDWVRAL